jgi:hypothetical protein
MDSGSVPLRGLSGMTVISLSIEDRRLKPTLHKAPVIFAQRRGSQID